MALGDMLLIFFLLLYIILFKALSILYLAPLLSNPPQRSLEACYFKNHAMRRSHSHFTLINTDYFKSHFTRRAQLGRWDHEKSVSAFVLKNLALNVPSIAFGFTKYFKGKKLPFLKGDVEGGILTC